MGLHQHVLAQGGLFTSEPVKDEKRVRVRKNRKRDEEGNLLLMKKRPLINRWPFFSIQYFVLLKGA